MRRLGAETIYVEKCKLSEEICIKAAVQRGLQVSGAERVVGVFHLACIDDTKGVLPIKKPNIMDTLNVKYKGQLALQRAIQLRDGDIFSVPGSVSTLVGTGGIGYAATNHACRALQLRQSSNLIAPYPAMGVSDVALRKSKLATDTWHLDKRQMEASAGISTCASQAFHFGQTHPRATPTTTADLIFSRTSAQVLDEYLNSTSPCLLFRDLAQLESQESIVSIENVVARYHPGRPMPQESEMEVTTFGTTQEALNAALSDVSGLSVEEITQAAHQEAFLSESFGIDSISSIRLGKRLEALGYKVLQEAIASSTYGAILSQLKLSRPSEDNKQSVSQALKTNDPAIGTGRTTGGTRANWSSGATSVTEAESLASEIEMTPDSPPQSSLLGMTVPSDSIPVSQDLRETVAAGHSVVSGEIIPSFWYAMVCCELLKGSIKVTLHRLSPLKVETSTVMLDDHSGSPTLIFVTKLPGKEPLIRSQVTRYNERLSPVPILAFSDRPDFNLIGVAEIYKKWACTAGFAFDAAYQSLRSYKVFGQVDESNKENFLAKCHVEAEGFVELSSDEKLSRAKAFFILSDAGLQSMILASGAMFAPARLLFQVEEPIDSWPLLVAASQGRFSVSTRFISTSSSQLEGISTVYVNRRPLFTEQCAMKGLPVPLGARLFPRFFCRKPVHTLICFHETGGSSQLYDPLSEMMAPQGSRVLSVDFPHHGRRHQQTDDDLVTTVEELAVDVAPWIREQVLTPGGVVIPYTVLGCSGGGVAAYGLVQRALVPQGLAPRALIPIVSPRPFVRNEHIERTHLATMENLSKILSYYSLVGGVDLMHLDEGQLTVDRLRSLLGVVHELTTAASERVQPLDLPIFPVGLENDPIVPWDTFQSWTQLMREGTTETEKRVLPLSKDLNHFIGLTGQADQVFSEIFFYHGMLETLLLLDAKTK